MEWRKDPIWSKRAEWVAVGEVWFGEKQWVKHFCCLAYNTGCEIATRSGRGFPLKAERNSQTSLNWRLFQKMTDEYREKYGASPS